jgi:hypothetical protein
LGRTLEPRLPQYAPSARRNKPAPLCFWGISIRVFTIIHRQPAGRASRRRHLPSNRLWRRRAEGHSKGDHLPSPLRPPAGGLSDAVARTTSEVGYRACRSVTRPRASWQVSPDRLGTGCRLPRRLQPAGRLGWQQWFLRLRPAPQCPGRQRLRFPARWYKQRYKRRTALT